MRPRIPMAERLARHTDVPLSVIQCTLANPTLGTGPCWPWLGSMSGVTPMIRQDGKTQGARRVIMESIYGSMPDTVQVRQACLGYSCVNPSHTQVKSKFSDAPHPMVPPEEDPEDLTDVIDSIYSCDPPWDADELAAKFDYRIDQIEAAILKIETEGL